MEPGTTPRRCTAWRAVGWAALFGGGGAVLLAAALFLGFAVVLVAIRFFLGVLGEPVSLRTLYDGGGDTALSALLGGHVLLLVSVAAITVVVAWAALWLLRRWEEVRAWWPSLQGLLAAATAYALVGFAAMLALLGGARG